MTAAMDTVKSWAGLWQFSWRSKGYHKVPTIITIWFWILKVLCTTVGEPIADYLRDDALGLPNAFYVTAAIMLAVLGVYTTGTTFTDEITKPKYLSFPEAWTIIIYFTCLGLAFIAWYAAERSLSIHTITTHRRELFYWLVVIITFALGTALGDVIGSSRACRSFALGTALGDVIADTLGLGFWQAFIIYAAAIAAIAVAYYALRLNATVAFWATYIVTRPLGASLGDALSKPASEDAAGLGPGVTAIVFLCAIAALVAYIGVSGKHMVDPHEVPDLKDRAGAAVAGAVETVASVLEAGKNAQLD
ncbi:hypothetical protein JKP88DRAFT_354338 [Tribonema minus]|uniref:Uncharacterized protein n=1 Tax=Tribonema minus TaxID=303371 RepID=A0A835YZR2_9STRA|nr:hypothetical protein JKP88DRAFT_354338 [Tribonema minus]